MKSYAQAGQDTWVHDLIGDTGVFVDVGAHDGIVHSNTYMLEQLGWTGICIEPNVDVFDVMVKNRSAEASAELITDYDGEIVFDGFQVSRKGHGHKVPCRRLSTLLVEFEAPSTIDYLSIDVEGHELEVLAGMDFGRWHVRVATIEHNAYCDGPGRKNSISEVMTGHGFECVVENVVAPGYGEFEDWWMHRDG